jgi:hypothetical protein
MHQLALRSDKQLDRVMTVRLFKPQFIVQSCFAGTIGALIFYETVSPASIVPQYCAEPTCEACAAISEKIDKGMHIRIAQCSLNLTGWQGRGTAQSVRS